MHSLPDARVREGRTPIPAEGGLHLANVVGMALSLEGRYHTLRWHHVTGTLDIILAFGIRHGGLKPNVYGVVTGFLPQREITVVNIICVCQEGKSSPHT